MQHKSDFQVALPLIGILLVCLGAIGLYVAGYVFGQLDLSANAWVWVGLILVPVLFAAVMDFAAPRKLKNTPTGE